LKKALKESVAASYPRGGGPELNLDNNLMWQLYTIKGPVIETYDDGNKLIPGGDYASWLRAALAIESEAHYKGKHPDEICKDVFKTKDPLGAMRGLITKYRMDDSIYSPIGERASGLFGKNQGIINMSRLSPGAYDAVKMLYENRVLMGIVSAAPSIESAAGYPNKMIRDRLVKEKIIPDGEEVFHPELIHWGKILNKTGQLKKSVINATEIIGHEPSFVFYIADINNDITQSAEANMQLKAEGYDIEIAPIMVECGMGLPNMWERAWKEAGFEKDLGYFEVEDTKKAAELIIDLYNIREIERSD
ncbi:MAG: hypothetical protein JRI49_08150, partial [Deltaproteobacteria bacterium]|nr:hypothetical protein [Deltaproteobacteria bacterium]